MLNERARFKTHNETLDSKGKVATIGSGQVSNRDLAALGDQHHPIDRSLRPSSNERRARSHKTAVRAPKIRRKSSKFQAR